MPHVSIVTRYRPPRDAQNGAQHWSRASTGSLTVIWVKVASLANRYKGADA
jgi:hypothetical protein